LAGGRAWPGEAGWKGCFAAKRCATVVQPEIGTVLLGERK
jgi:hypothetical protein